MIYPNESLVRKKVMYRHMLDLKPFEEAIKRLEEGLASYQKMMSISPNNNISKKDNEVIRDGCIQRFEYTYGICLSMMCRYLETYSLEENIDALTFAEIIRKSYGAEITSLEFIYWKAFRDMRNKTSHAYNETIALAVFEKIDSFLTEARFVLKTLRKKVVDAENAQS